MTKFLIYLLMGLFAVGAIGCLITIPAAAIKFFSVLIEKDKPEDLEAEPGASEPVSRGA